MAHSDNLGLSRRPPVHKAVIPAHVCRGCAEKQKYLRRSGNSDSTLLICDSLLLQYDGVSVRVCVIRWHGREWKRWTGPQRSRSPSSLSCWEEELIENQPSCAATFPQLHPSRSERTDLRLTNLWILRDLLRWAALTERSLVGFI